MNTRLLTYSTLLSAALLPGAAWAQHENDNIYGAVNGQIRTVDPTNAGDGPRMYGMNFVQGASSASLVTDVGFDVWSYGGTITEVASARLNGRILTHGLQVRDNLRSFFAPASYYGQPEGSTNVRQFFTLSGSSRHKHFTFFTSLIGSRRTYDFEYWFTDAVDIHGNALGNSPVYRMKFVADPRFQEVPGTSPVPEPATLAVLGLGSAILLRRKRKA